MQLFFNTPSVANYGILRYAGWNYVRDGLLRNLETTKNYYYSRIYSVKTNHFLARLIDNINVSHNFELERYYDIVDGKSASIASAMRMSTSYQKSSLFNGVFYGPGCPEIIITDFESFNPFEVYKNWKTVSAVKVIAHPRSDYDLMLPNGKETSSEKGLAVISINIAMLAVQFRAFAADQMQLDRQDGTGLQSTAHFIHRFVLPNMLPSHLDYCVLNRLNNIFNGAPLPQSPRRQPFALADLTGASDRVHQQLISDFRGKSMEYKSLLKTIPAVSQLNMESVLTIPDNPPTRQIVWAEVLSRLPALKLMIDLGGQDSIKRNVSVLNYFAREFVLYSQDRSLQSVLPRDIYKDAFYDIKKICLLVGKEFR
jgi:hypothetical protein